MYKWYASDAYLGSKSTGDFLTHEAICMLNPTKTDAVVRMTLYYTNRECLKDFVFELPAERTLNLRMDKIENIHGVKPPVDEAYAIGLESEVELVMQYTRVMAVQPELTMMTTALPAKEE